MSEEKRASDQWKLRKLIPVINKINKSSIAEGIPKQPFESYGNDGTCDCIRSYRNLNHSLDRMAK